MMLTEYFAFDIAILFLGYIFVNYLTRWKKQIPKGLRLPPGPPGKPFIGNLQDMPTHHEWETATQWKEKYGPLVYVNVLGQPMVFVNTSSDARKLFDERSALYSDRHETRMLSMCGWDFNFGFMRYGERWRRHRRAFHQFFNERACTTYFPVQEKHARNMVKRMYDEPKAFVDHVNLAAASNIMEVIYGITIQPTEDTYIENAHKALEGVIASATPGAFLVDLFPILKYVPEWMPGAGFKRKAREWRSWAEVMSAAPFDFVQKGLKNGTVKSSVLSSCLARAAQAEQGRAKEEELIRDTCGVSYSAGASTVIGAVNSFILAMVLHPETQRKAQAEIDAVIGDRLPNIGDRSQLPYIVALVNEVQRWRPVAPLAIAHAVTQDDVYGEYFFPKGTIVIGNAWAILREEAYGPRPDEFDPDRYFNPDVPDVPAPIVQYGFGRRVCPGRYFADNALFLLVASILKVFDISHAKDSAGNDIPVDSNAYSSGLVCEPEPFECSIKPRSEAHIRLIPEEMED